MRLVVHGGERRGVRRGAGLNLRPQDDARHPLIAVSGLFHVTRCRVAIKVDDKSTFGGEERNQSVCSGSKRHECLLQVDARRIGKRPGRRPEMLTPARRRLRRTPSDGCGCGGCQRLRAVGAFPITDA